MKEVHRMKKVYLSIILGVFLLYGCGDGLKGIETDYAIKITGSDKLKFSGHYSFVGMGSVPKPVNIEGAVPAEYSGKGIAAVCVFRKTTAEGTMKVEILKEGKVVSASETAVPYGVISLGKAPDQESIINQILKKIFG
jgi:hypothetical protein